MAGHYYAYIRCFDNDKWYSFNDTEVMEIDENDIERVFGEDANTSWQHRSGANAYMLMYRKVDRVKNLLAVHNEDVPKYLFEMVKRENESSKQKEEAKRKAKEIIKLKVHLGPEKRAFEVNKSLRIDDVAKLAAQHFGIENKFSTDCLRLRAYYQYYNIPVEPLPGGNMLSDFIGNWYGDRERDLALETKEPSEEWPEYKKYDRVYKASKLNLETKQYDPYIIFSMDSDARLSDLKDLLHPKFKIPKEKLLIVKTEDDSTLTLRDDSKILKSDYKCTEGTTFYVEESENVDGESIALDEIDRLKNAYEICYNIPPNIEPTQIIKIDQRATLGQFKEKIAPILGLSLDEFKVMRGHEKYATELKNEKETLKECYIWNGRVVIEKGRPMRHGETKISFFIYEPNPADEKKGEILEELFEIPIPEDMLIREMKETLSVKLKEEKKIEINPNNMRIRELQVRTPSKIYADNYSFKHVSTSIYNGRPLAITNLGHEEPVKSDKQLVPIVIRFYPSKYEFGIKEEYVLSEDITCDEFKKLLAEKFSLRNVQLAKITHGQPNVLDAPDLEWDRKAYGDRIGTLYNSPYYLRDGDTILFRDAEEQLKQLTKEEKDKIQKAINVSKRSVYQYKEKELKINT